MPEEIWQITVDRSPEILRKAITILRKMKGQEWNSDSQERFAIELTRNKIIRSTRPTAGIGRAIFANLKFFGFAFTEDGKISITPVGNKFVRASGTDRVDIIKAQLLKWHYPNPDQRRIKEIRLFPLRACLKIIHDLQYVSSDEMTLFVIKTKTKDEIKNIEKKIRDFRKKNEREKEERRAEEADFYHLEHIAWEHAARFFEATGLCSRVRIDSEKRLIIADNRLNEIKEIISRELEPHRVFETEADWFQFYGSVEPLFTIDLKVQLPNGQGIAGAVVKALDPTKETEIKKEVTNDVGTASIWLPQGIYKLSVMYNDTEILNTTVSLERDLSTVITTPLIVPPRKEPDVVELLQKAEDLRWEHLEHVIARAYEELLGSKEWVEWRGGSGEPDIIIEAPMALTFGYAVIEGTKRGKAGLSLEIPEARDHAQQVKARYAVLVSTEPFRERRDDRRMINIARRMDVILMTANCLAELVRFHREVGGITHEELKVLFDKASPLIDDVLDQWKDNLLMERSHFFLAVEAYAILAKKSAEMTVDDILAELREKHKVSGNRRILVNKPNVQKALDILTSIGVITRRGIDYYKAMLSWEVFFTRLQRLSGLVGASKGKFKPITFGKGLEKYIR